MSALENEILFSVVRFTYIPAFKSFFCFKYGLCKVINRVSVSIVSIFVIDSYLSEFANFSNL